MSLQLTTGERVKKLREQKGWSLIRLGEKADVTISYLSTLEADKKSEPSAPHLLKVAQALDTTLEYLLTGAEEKRFPIITNLEPELREIFLELLDDPNSTYQFRKTGDLSQDDWIKILDYIKFQKTQAKKIREERGL